MLGKQGFNEWAAEYDETVRNSDRDGSYPFAGYGDVLTDVFNTINDKQQAEVLDIGFGTGALSAALYDKGHRIAGIDFSSEMIERAAKKMPEAELMDWDMADGLPPIFDGRLFDCIISTYALHHLYDAEKWRFLQHLLKQLAPGGVLVIGDIAFRTRQDREACRSAYAKVWDGDEEYTVFEELEAALSGIADCEFTAHSHCGAVIKLRPACPFCHPSSDAQQHVVFENERPKTGGSL
jgi:2-polyprenyl-3-methyl-5-hydroxy-6-metoxy-1,4-benzoquinol methylase